MGIKWNGDLDSKAINSLNKRIEEYEQKKKDNPKEKDYYNSQQEGLKRQYAEKPKEKKSKEEATNE